MSDLVKITRREAKVLLNWYDTAIAKASHYGSAQYVFPDEDSLVNKLKNTQSQVYIDSYEIDTIMGWMEKAMGVTPGQAEYYFPDEQKLVEKLRYAKGL